VTEGEREIKEDNTTELFLSLSLSLSLSLRHKSKRQTALLYPVCVCVCVLAWARGYLGPGEDVIEVVLKAVVLGQTQQVAVLHRDEIVNAAWSNRDHAVPSRAPPPRERRRRRRRRRRRERRLRERETERERDERRERER
jgi:hypothetical protein